MAIVVGAYLVAVLVGFVTTRTSSTAATIDVYLDPVDVASLFDPPDTVRSPEADLEAQVATVTSAELDALVEAELGRPVSITVDEIVVDEGRLAIVVDAGSAGSSMTAATEVGASLLELRRRQGVAQAEGGLAAIEANLERLRGERADAVDAEQLATIDQTIADQEAAAAQLEASIVQLGDLPTGTVGAPSDPRIEQPVVPRAALTFVLVLVSVVVGSWWWRRRFGPVPGEARTVAGRPAVLVADDADLRSLVLDARLAHVGAGTSLVVLGVDAETAAVAARRVAAAAPSAAAALVDPSQEGVPDLAALAAGDDLPSRPDGGVVVVGGAVDDGTIATRRTAASLERLAAAHEVVVVAGGAAATQAAIGWSAHADVVVVSAVAGVTSQRDLRRAFAWLEGHGIEARVVVFSSLQAGESTAQADGSTAPSEPAPVEA